MADVAVCTLCDDAMIDGMAGHPRIAAVAPLATANLGIEALVLGTLARPSVRHLVVCGRDSPLFRAGQSLLALTEHGIDDNGTIIGARGYRPRLPSLRPGVIAEFRRRIIVHDMLGCVDCGAVLAAIDTLARLPDRSDQFQHEDQPPDALAAEIAASRPRLVRLPAHGRRKPISSARQGYFVVSLDRAAHDIVLQHYHEDLASGHELRSHSATALLMSALSHHLVGDPAHTGYLGGELAKAETALRMGLNYIQDRPLGHTTRHMTGHRRS